MAKNKRDQLINLIEQKVFKPIVNKKESAFRTKDRKAKFRDLKKSTESEMERFHRRYKTAADVKDNYYNNLNTKTAKKKNKEAKELGLPQLIDIKEDFDKLCDKLNIQ